MVVLFRKETKMNDDRIVELYWQRDEQAIRETDIKYGSYCLKISLNILANAADGEENVNDTYLKAWMSMPPHRPENLMAFLGKLTRNLALNKYKAKYAERRIANEFALSVDELDDCTPSNTDVDNEILMSELSKNINGFLHSQKKEIRDVFICRYFFCDSVKEISERFGYSQNKVKSILMRARKRLRLYLEKEGYFYEE